MAQSTTFNNERQKTRTEQNALTLCKTNILLTKATTHVQIHADSTFQYNMMSTHSYQHCSPCLRTSSM